jgi:hypothetical protein
MAIKQKVDGRSYSHIYNVTMTVGSRKSVYVEDGITTYTSTFEPNKPDDVMLVQYLLKRIYQRCDLFPGSGLDKTNGTCLLKIDGYHGPKTQKAIEMFQIEMRRAGRNIATDGCVDPEKGLTSSISKTGYTITWLNKYLSVFYPEFFPDIRLDPECPATLKASIGLLLPA